MQVHVSVSLFKPRGSVPIIIFIYLATGPSGRRPLTPLVLIHPAFNSLLLDLPTAGGI